MPNLSALANIPGYGAYVAKRQMNEQAGMQDLQQMGALMSIQQKMQEQKTAREDLERGNAMRAEIEALPPNKRNRETVLPIILKYARGVKETAAALPDVEKKQPVGAGGLYDPATKSVIPPVVKPDKPVTTTLQKLLTERDALPQGDPRRATYDAAIKKETERAPQQPQQYPVIQTPEGVFERRPEGLVRLNVPGTNQPLTAKGTGADGLTPENAGKVAMSQQAVEGIGTVRGIVFDKDGKLNRGVVGAMNLPIVSGLSGNSQARIARSAIRNAIEAKLRIETGAAATESEVERTLARFLPTISDTDTSAKFKLDELEKFFKTSLSLTKGIKPPAKPTNDPLGIR
jgi:hypothetical protein